MADSPYIIRFIQLPVGQHPFGFRIDDSFFQQHEASIIRGAEVDVQAVLYKSSNVAMHLDLVMKGLVSVDCVRCLEPFQLPVEVSKSLVVRMVETPSAEEDDEDTIQIALAAHELDLSQALYDFLTLAVPYSPVHPDKADRSSGCDPEVLKHIRQSGTIDEHPDGEAEGDDRWNILKKIKFN
jgi:uncharacterized metal-binding protein YceD (DUF177 family)